METEDLHDLLDDLTTNIDDLSTTLGPLLSTPLPQQTAKLPLLDQAKLYTLAVYSIESLLFSSLRLNGVDAKSHPVFQELGRVKEYFGKIKVAENGPEKRPTTLDKDAAGRFIKHGLRGNEKYDRERAERVGREKAGAKRKLEEMSEGRHTRLDGEDARRVKVVRADDAEGESDGVGEGDGSGGVEGNGNAETSKRKEKGKKARTGFGQGYVELAARDATEDATNVDDGAEGVEEDEDDDVAAQSTREAHSQRPKKSKKPKDSKEALESLLEGALDSKKDKKKKRKKSEKLEDERAAEMK